jgi:MSHA biogenesis protein MshK
MARRMRTLLLLLGVACSAAAGAQGLSDPTRPPGVASPASTTGSADEMPVGPQLQSVLIAQGRRVAVINGTTVALGGMLGDAKVIKISETEVVLKRGQETEVLKMYPGIEKQAAKRRVSRHGGAK